VNEYLTAGIEAIRIFVQIVLVLGCRSSSKAVVHAFKRRAFATHKVRAHGHHTEIAKMKTILQDMACMEREWRKERRGGEGFEEKTFEISNGFSP
jgi:hypothetical protein